MVTCLNQTTVLNHASIHEEVQSHVSWEKYFWTSLKKYKKL